MTGAHAKRYREALTLFDHSKEHQPAEAIRVVKQFPDAKFDETVEVVFRLGIDPRKADQAIRGTVSLPNGTGRSVRVAAFAVGEKAREASEAGADLVGGEELVEDVIKGNIDFDAAVATPDMMAAVGKAGRVLGPRGARRRHAHHRGRTRAMTAGDHSRLEHHLGVYRWTPGRVNLVA